MEGEKEKCKWKFTKPENERVGQIRGRDRQAGQDASRCDLTQNRNTDCTQITRRWLTGDGGRRSQRGTAADTQTITRAAKEAKRGHDRK